MAQLQYNAPSSLCADVYNTYTGGELEAFHKKTRSAFTLNHPDGRFIKFDPSNNMLRLNGGDTVYWTKYTQTDVYGSDMGLFGLFKNGDRNQAMRHTGFVMFAHPFKNHFDWAWFFIYNTDNNSEGYYIFNAYGGGHYVGYDQDNDQLRIVPWEGYDNGRVKPVKWSITDMGSIKSKLKAAAILNRAQGTYYGENVYKNVDACVYPAETLDSMKIQNSTCAFTGGIDDVFNAPRMNLSTGGVLDGDRDIAGQQVQSGQGVYPQYACSLSTSDQNSFIKGIDTSGKVIDSDNESRLNILRKDVSSKFLRVLDLYKQITNQQNDLRNATNDFNSYLNDCTNNRKRAQELEQENGRLTQECNIKKQSIKSQLRPNFCMDVANFSQSDYGPIWMWDCHGGTNQRWRIDDQSHIISSHSGKCLNVLGGARTPATQVIQYTCQGPEHNNDKWYMDDANRLHPFHAPDMCLDVHYGKTNNSANLVIWPCHDGANQKWTMKDKLVAQPGIQLYFDCWFQGQSVRKGVGRYNLNDMGLPNDSISSMRIPSGLKITIYQHANFGGISKTYVGPTDVQCLVNEPMTAWGQNWNDQVSSFIIEVAVPEPLKPATGSFGQSCYNCYGNVNEGNGWMQCDCKNMNGRLVNSRIDNLKNCRLINNSPQVANINGQLKC